MIAYKVVEKGTRHCSNWAMYKAYCKYHNLPIDVYLRKKYPDLFPRYLKGTIVEKAPGTVGIFCFPSLVDAHDFLGALLPLDIFDYKIIKVEGIGKPTYKPKIFLSCSNPANLVDVIRINPYNSPVSDYNGTYVTFPKVKVLE